MSTPLTNAEIVRQNLSRILGYQVQFNAEPDWVVQQRNRNLSKPISEQEFNAIMATFPKKCVRPKDSANIFEDGWYDAVECAKNATQDGTIISIIDSIQSLMSFNAYAEGKYQDGYTDAKEEIEERLKSMISAPSKKPSI